MTLARLKRYMVERESIRVCKEAGGAWPWTRDAILQKYKFTNVKRANDRTTRAFKAIYDVGFDGEQYEALLYNCGIARYFGTTAILDAVGYRSKHSASVLINAAARIMARGDKVFTGAYIVTNSGRPGPKSHVVAEYLGGLWRARTAITYALIVEQRWENAFNVMHALPGFGGSGFMAKEVLQDFLLVVPTAGIEDRHTWTPMGPGARRGMNRLLGRDVRFRQPVAKYITEVQRLHVKLRDWWADATPWPYGEPLTAHDVQFCLCEYDKYERVRHDEGRPKGRYHPPVAKGDAP